MGCGCGCECEEEKEHKHEHCGKAMECKEDKYVCAECGFEEECDCKETKEDTDFKDDGEPSDE